MRVHCDNCKAAYDIDDSRVPESGLAVKCARCNTLFVVKPQKIQPEIVEPLTLTPVDEENVDWEELEKSRKKFKGFILRRPDGRTYPFQEMATLQRWVVERKALRSDYMSDDGETWRSLADMKELEPFFAVVSSAGTLAAMQARQTQSDVQQNAERPRMTMQMWAQPAGTQEALSAEGNAAADKAQEKQIASGIVQENIASTFSDGASAASAAAESEAAEKPQMPRVRPEQPKVKVEAKKASREDFEDTRITLAPVKPVAEPQFPARDEKPQKMEIPAPEEKAVPEEPKKRASGGVLSARRGNTDEFDLAKWDAMADDDSAASGRKGKIILAAVAIAVVAAVAAVIFVPQVRGLVFKGSAPAAELAKLDTARAAMNTFSDAGLDEAAGMVKPITETLPEFSAAWAMMTEIASARADLWGYKLEEAEKFQKDTDSRIQELKAAYEEAKSQADKEKLRAELEKATQDLNAANQAVAEAANRVNEQIAQLDAFAGRCFELEPESLETNRALAEFYRAGAQAAKSNEFLEKALKINPNDAPSLYTKGALLSADAALLTDAENTLEAAIAADGSLIKARFRLAHVFLKSGKVEEAVKTLEELLAVNSNHQPALDLLAKLKKTAEAAAVPAPALAPLAEGEAKNTAPEAAEKEKPKPAGPSTYEEFMRAGDAQRNADNPNGALGNYKKAWELKQTVNAASGLGFCYYDLFNYKEALNYFKKAAGMSSGDQATLIGLAMTYDKLNDTNKALEYYKIYLRQFPKGEDAQFAKNAIERLQPQQ